MKRMLRTPTTHRLFPTFIDELLNDNMMNKLDNRNIPAVNIIETETGFELEVIAPGFEKNEIDTAVEGDRLVIRGNHMEEHETNQRKYTSREFRKLNFERSFHLPENINHDEIKGHYTGGIVRIELPKTTPEKPKKKRIELA